MRIHRDVRFSRDKSPYKDGFGAVIVRGGRRSGRFGYYLHLAPEGETRLAGGMHDPSPAQLARFREAVVRDPKDLQAILHSAPFRRHFVGLRGDSLKTVPRGYPTDHPRVDLLRLKQAYVMEQVPDAVVLSPTFPRLAVDCYKAMKPLLDWINGVAAANASRRSLTVSRSRRRP
jgi:uncharacterized protein (TIGR02453 family)